MRIAHVPATHPYVHGVDPNAVMVPGPWDVGRLVNAGVDLVHVHFGFEHLTPSDLGSWIDEVRRAGLALVHTVHDIDNPHLVDQTDHHARTAELVRRADGLATLTEQAAHEIHREWGRRPTVIPHPPIVADPAQVASSPPADPDDRVLVWMSTLRPNLDLVAIEHLVAESENVFELVVRRTAWQSASDELRERAVALAESPNVDLVLVDRFDDDELARRIADASVLVLPYAWGTHSGLVELATDMGTPVVTTPGGARGDQGAFVAPSLRLAACVDALVASPPIVRRRASTCSSAVRKEHRRLYEAAALRAAQRSALVR